MLSFSQFKWKSIKFRIRATLAGRPRSSGECERYKYIAHHARPSGLTPDLGRHRRWLACETGLPAELIRSKK